MNFIIKEKVRILYKEMEKMVWDTLVVPELRQRLIDKYVPKEPIDPLVYKVTAFYWLMQELVGNWKSGHRLTFDQKAQLLQLLVWNFSRVHQEQAAYEANTIHHQCFDNPRETVALCETSDEEEYDTSISRETTEQIAQLVLACKEFQLKVTDDLDKSQVREVD